MTPRARTAAGSDDDHRVRAADLEGADRLERLGLEEPSIRRGTERDERGPGRDAAQDRGGRPDVLERDERRVAHQRAPRSRSRWQSMQVAAHGSASSRAAAIGFPQRTHAPNDPSSSRASAVLDERELRGRPVAEGEVALLLEDLAGRRGLRAVGHLPGRDDRLADLRREARALGEQGGARGVVVGGSHRRMLPPHRPCPCPTPILPTSTGTPAQPRRRPMAIAIDPVCGMEVDTDHVGPVVGARRDHVLVLRPGLHARLPGRPGQVPRPGSHPVHVSTLTAGAAPKCRAGC